MNITKIKFSKGQNGYKITAIAAHPTPPITADYTVWATSTHPDSIREARDRARAGALSALEALAEGLES